jgi:hypothetical protein
MVVIQKEGETKRSLDRRAERKTSLYITTQQTMCCLNAGSVETIGDGRCSVVSCITRGHVQARFLIAASTFTVDSSVRTDTHRE